MRWHLLVSVVITRGTKHPHRAAYTCDTRLDHAGPIVSPLQVGGGEGQSRYDYTGPRWHDGRLRDDKDVEGPAAGSFITVVGLQVDGRWQDGIFTGSFLRQWGTRGGWAACGLQFLGKLTPGGPPSPRQHRWANGRNRRRHGQRP